MISHEMSRALLASKYKPRTIDSFVGNAEVKEVVSAFLDSDNKSQVIGITGESGYGKTTLARFIAWKCTDSYKDFVVVDCLKQIGVKRLSTLWDILKPVEKGYRVHLIDECHMMPKDVQERLAWALDNLPKNVLVIFCTFRPEYLTSELRSKWQVTLELKKPTGEEIVEVLRNICITENKGYDEEGLYLLANKSNFIIREAIYLLQSAFSLRDSADISAVSETLYTMNIR